MAVLLLAELNGSELDKDQTGKALTAAKELGDVTILVAGEGAQGAAEAPAQVLLHGPGLRLAEQPQQEPFQQGVLRTGSFVLHGLLRLPAGAGPGAAPIQVSASDLVPSFRTRAGIPDTFSMQPLAMLSRVFPRN